MNPNASVIRAGYVDNEEYHIAAWEHNSKKPIVAVIVPWVVPVASLVLVFDAVRGFHHGDKGWWGGLLGGAFAIFLVWFLFSSTAGRWRLRRVLRKTLTNPPTKGWFEFSDDGFMATGTGGSSSFHPWGTVLSATEHSDGILLSMDAMGFAYYWIPMTSFSSTSDYAKVLSQVAAKVAKLEKRNRS